MVCADGRLGSSLFSAADLADTVAVLADYLDYIASAPGVQQVKAASHAMLAVEVGHVLADVGCGTGLDLPALAAQVGPTGRVLGIDLSAAMLTEAGLAGPSGVIRLIRAGSHALPIASDSLDAARAERLLIHDPRPELTIAELARVVRAGGRVVLVEPDLTGLVLEHPDAAITGQILPRYLARNFATPMAGRELRRLMIRAGLDVTRHRVHVLNCDFTFADVICEFTALASWAAGEGLLSAGGCRSWLASLRSLDESGAFRCLLPVHIGCGVKPGNRERANGED